MSRRKPAETKNTEASLDRLAAQVAEEKPVSMSAAKTRPAGAAVAAHPISDATMRQVVDTAPVAMMISDRDGIITYVNRALTQALEGVERALPCRADNLVGRSLEIFREYTPHLSEILDPAALPRPAEITLGEDSFVLHVNALNDSSDSYSGRILTWENVTEKVSLQRRHQAEAVKNADYLSEIEAINRSHAVIEFDLDGTIRTANPNFLDALGYRLEEIRGKHHSIFIDDQTKRSPEYRAFWAALADGERRSGEFERLRKDGSSCWIRGSYNPILDADGKPSRVVKYVEDISEQKEQQERLRRSVDEMLDVVQRAKDGDLTIEIPVRGDDAIGQMGLGLEGFIGDLRATMTLIAENAQQLSASAEELTAVSQQMAGSAESTSSQATVVSAAGEEVTRNVQVAAAGAEQMSASIREISKSSAEAARIAQQAVDAADSANSTIRDLGGSSVEIGKVIKVITSIAQQTNLLALNATIEAARAGEAGKGFAVVANEVKELAKQTARATEDISQKIEAIQQGSKGAVEAIAEVGSIINQINDISNTIASAVEEQTATTNEISRNVSEAARGSADIGESVSGVAAAAESATHGANDTLQAAKGLSTMSAQLQEMVGRFQV